MEQEEKLLTKYTKNRLHFLPIQTCNWLSDNFEKECYKYEEYAMIKSEGSCT